MVDTEARQKATPPVAGPFGLPPTVGIVDLLAVAAMFLMPTAVIPSVDNPAIVAKIAVLAVFLGIGLVLLVDLARRGDLPARLALVLAAVWILAGILAPSSWLSFVGGYSIDRGVLVLLGYLGLWALGRSVDPATRPFLLGAALLAVAFNVLIGAVQLNVDLGSRFLAVGAPDRAVGMTPSSVYLGGVCAAGAGAASAAAARAGSTARLALYVGLVFVASAGANLTGSRIAVIAVVVVGPVAALVRRARWRRVLLVVAAIVVGLLAGVPGDSTTTTSRTADAAGAGVGTRTEMWGHGVDAWIDRPLLGWGPGRFREATSPRITRTFALDEGPDKIFFDAHNGAVEMLTTTGLLGVVALGAFVVTAVWRARGALAWLAAAVTLTWLAEPISISAASMAMLALGAAYRDPPTAAGAPVEERARPRSVALVAGAMGVAGLVLGGALLWGGTQMKQGADQADLAAARQAQRVFRNDSAVTDLQSQILYGNYGVDKSPATLAALLASTEQAVDQDPTYHLWWVRLGTIQLMADDPEGARRSFTRALERNPWSISAWYGMRSAARALDDRVLEARADAKLCLLSDEFCE